MAQLRLVGEAVEEGPVEASGGVCALVAPEVDAVLLVMRGADDDWSRWRGVDELPGRGDELDGTGELGAVEELVTLRVVGGLDGAAPGG